MTQLAGYFQNYDSTDRPSQVNGVDVSHWQLDDPHDFAAAYAAGARFVAFKAGGMTSASFNARYIRCTVNGSYTNTSSIFTEVKVYANWVNVAKNKTVTGSAASPQVGSYANAVDENLGTYVIVGDNTQWLKVDLGATFSCQNIVLWHYPNRKFKSNKVEYSTDNINWTTLFDSATNGEYFEVKNSPTRPFVGCDIIKGGASVMARDTSFTAAEVASARAAGLKVGAYFFKNPNYCYNGKFLNSAGDGSSQGSAFWQYVTSAMGIAGWADTYVWLDWENGDGYNIYPSIDNDGSYAYAKAFCDTVRLLSYGNRQCGIYTGWFCIDEQTAITANTLVHSTLGGLASVCPLWYTQSVDLPYGSAYPARYGWSQGQFGGWTSWDMWQFSTTNNSAARFGFAAGDLDLDVCEGPITNIMPPTKVSQLAGVGASYAVTATWTTGESDVYGYMLKISGQATATVGTGIGSAEFVGLIPNASYAISAYAYDKWELSTAVADVTVLTTGIVVGYGALFSTKL